MSFGGFALVVTAFAVCLAFATAVYPQTAATGRLEPSDAARLRDLAENGHAASALQLGVTYMEVDPAEAVKWIRLAAEQEHPEAQAILGRLYYAGNGVPRDYSETLKWYRRAVEQDNPTAQFYLGLMYYNGHGVPKDHSEAAKWIRRAADQGDAEAQFELGGMYSAGAGVPQDYAESAQWYRRAGEQGYADAQFVLWLPYHEGRGVAKDPVEAARWLRLAAEQGHADAQFKLGTLYLQGDGVPQDGVEAVRWLRRAAQQGHAQTLEMFGDTLDELAELGATLGGGSEAPGDTRFDELLGAAEGGDADAQYDLATAYARGDVGDDEGKELALSWLLRAAHQGHTGAMAELGGIYLGTDGMQALRWFRAAAEQGNGQAQTNLGHMYAEGLGVPQDHAEAARWTQLAAAQGIAQAQYNLGLMYAAGWGVSEDTDEAIRLLRLAAEQGHPDALEALRRTEPRHTLPSSSGSDEPSDAEAQYSLGRRYGVEGDNAEAVRWYRLAAEQGHAAAQLLLGFQYETGNGVERDFSQAVRWYRLAAENGDDDAVERIESLETWRCFDMTDFNRTNVLRTLTHLEHTGEVSVAGTTYWTAFEVRGLDRRWDFGVGDDGTFDYMFRIEPDGTGLYYDFSRSTDGTVSPRQTFKCEQLRESTRSESRATLRQRSVQEAGVGETEEANPEERPVLGRPGCDTESRVDGEFEGWEGDTLVKLMNGQIWEQSEWHYEYSYAYMPRVTIFRAGGQCKMWVEGIDEPVGVTRVK